MSEGEPLSFIDSNTANKTTLEESMTQLEISDKNVESERQEDSDRNKRKMQDIKAKSKAKSKVITIAKTIAKITADIKAKFEACQEPAQAVLQKHSGL